MATLVAVQLWIICLSPSGDSKSRTHSDWPPIYVQPPPREGRLQDLPVGWVPFQHTTCKKIHLVASFYQEEEEDRLAWL